MELDLGQIVSQIIAFLVMLAVLKHFAWRPLLHILEVRQQRIKDEFDFIAEQKALLLQQQEEYSDKLALIETQARQKIQEGIAQGHGVAYKIEATAREQAKAIIAKAQLEAAEELAAAKIKLKKELVVLTMAATHKMLQGILNPERQQELLAEFANQVDQHEA